MEDCTNRRNISDDTNPLPFEKALIIVTLMNLTHTTSAAATATTITTTSTTTATATTTSTSTTVCEVTTNH